MSRQGFLAAQDQVHKAQLREIQERKALPYSITDNVDKGSAMRFNTEVEIRNAHKAHSRRESAMSAFNNGSGDVREAGAFKEYVGANVRQTIPSNQPLEGIVSNEQTYKSSIVTRIYNWFLNIQY